MAPFEDVEGRLDEGAVEGAESLVGLTGPMSQHRGTLSSFGG